MLTQHAAWVPAQDAARRQRLYLEHVQCRREHLRTFQRGFRRWCVDNRAAPHVHHAQAGLALGQHLGVEHVLAARGERAVDDDNVRLVDALGPGDGLHLGRAGSSAANGP